MMQNANADDKFSLTFKTQQTDTDLMAIWSRLYWIKKKLFFYATEDPRKTRIYLLKSCIFILMCLNFSHLQSTLLLMQYTYPKMPNTTLAGMALWIECRPGN